MNKRKLNWVDFTVIALLVVLIGVAVCFFCGLRGGDNTAEGKLFEVVMDTKRCDNGQHDSVAIGEVFSVFNGGAFATLEKEPEIIPYKSVIFDEQSKGYKVTYSEDLCHYRMTFVVEGTLDEYNQLNVGGILMNIDKDFVIESPLHRLNMTIRSVKEVTE